MQPNNGAAANDVPPQDGGVVDAAQGQAAAANQNVAVANQDVAGQNNQQNNGRSLFCINGLLLGSLFK